LPDDVRFLRGFLHPDSQVQSRPNGSGQVATVSCIYSAIVWLIFWDCFIFDLLLFLFFAGRLIIYFLIILHDSPQYLFLVESLSFVKWKRGLLPLDITKIFIAFLMVTSTSPVCLRTISLVGISGFLFEWMGIELGYRLAVVAHRIIIEAMSMCRWMRFPRALCCWDRFGLLIRGGYWTHDQYVIKYARNLSGPMSFGVGGNGTPFRWCKGIPFDVPQGWSPAG
jgi:hypothetical protein